MSDHPGIGGLRLVLGGNVFGWTADRDTSFAVLDAFHASGGRMIDTADAYSVWVPGHHGGESEAIIGEWMASRGARGDMLIHTKTGMLGGAGGLAPERTQAALDASLARLRTDYVDLFYAHRDDTETPLEEIARGLGALVEGGKIRELGASNFTAPRLEAAIAAARSAGAGRYSVLQNQYNLLERSEHPPEMVALAEREGVVFLPYYALAASFLTGKYRKTEDWRGTARAARLDSFAERGFPMLEMMDGIVAETGASHAQIALAWLNAQPGVGAPIASATSVAQLEELVAGARLELSAGQLALLDAA